MNPNQQEPVKPGRALNGLLLAAVITGLFYLWTRAGMDLAWLGVIGGALAMLEAWGRLVRAHRADKERKAVEDRGRRVSEIFTTGGRWEEEPKDRDKGWPHR